MSLKRILKLLAAIFAGQGVSIVTQLLIPPLFLRRYAHGVEVYGEWVALAAVVSYLNTLNYGIQNYANNQMSIHYNRGEMEEARAVQASAFRMLLVAVVVVLTAGATVLLLPLSQWMGLTTITSRSASATVYLLIVQIVTNWCFAFLAGSYMALGESHRGQHWTNGQRFFTVLTLSAFLWVRAPFPILALVQLLSSALFAFLVLLDLRMRAPILVPALRFGSWKKTLSLIRPTGYFALLAVSAFFSFQGPVLVIEKILGPAAVAIFALTRVVFNMGRQLLSIVTFSIAQDITRLVGQRSWVQLGRLYEFSERVVLLLIPTTTICTLLLSPLLFTVWLHKRSLYVPAICLTMAAYSAVMGIKEHKVQFQWSSNEHTGLSKFTLVMSFTTLVASAFLLKPFGVQGFLCLWIASEILQVAYILNLNTKLFPREVNISKRPVIRLAGILALSFTLAAWPARQGVHWPLPLVIATAMGTTAVVGFVSYFAFDLTDVLAVLRTRLRRRLAVIE